MFPRPPSQARFLAESLPFWWEMTTSSKPPPGLWGLCKVGKCTEDMCAPWWEEKRQTWGPLAKNIVFICVKLCSNLFKSVRHVIKHKRFEMFRKRLDPFAFVIHDHPWLSMKITVNVRDELSFSLQDGLQGGKLSSGFLGWVPWKHPAGMKAFGVWSGHSLKDALYRPVTLLCCFPMFSPPLSGKRRLGSQLPASTKTDHHFPSLGVIDNWCPLVGRVEVST